MTSRYGLNVYKYYVFKFCFGFMLFGGVLIPFFTDWGRLSFTQVMILQAWYMLCVVLLEIPTGAVADYIGRKDTIALGALFCVAAVLIYTSTPNFYVFLIGEFFWAASTAILSGADQAFIYDSLKTLNRENESKKVLGRSESTFLSGMMIASPIGSLLASVYGTRLMVMATAIPFALAFISVLTFKEPERLGNTEKKSYTGILKGGFKVFYNNKALKILTLDMIVISVIGFMMIWMFQPMLKQAGVGIEYYGFVHLALIAAEVAIISNFERLERLTGSKKGYIFASAFITGIAFIVGGLTSFIPIVILAIVVGGGFGMSRKILVLNYMNKFIPSSERATTISIISTMNNITFVVFYPVIGIMAEWSISYTLVILGACAAAFSIISKVEEEHLLD